MNSPIPEQFVKAAFDQVRRVALPELDRAEIELLLPDVIATRDAARPEDAGSYSGIDHLIERACRSFRDRFSTQAEAIEFAQKKLTRKQYVKSQAHVDLMAAEKALIEAQTKLNEMEATAQATRNKHSELRKTSADLRRRVGDAKAQEAGLKEGAANLRSEFEEKFGAQWWGPVNAVDCLQSALQIEVVLPLIAAKVESLIKEQAAAEKALAEFERVNHLDKTEFSQL